MHSLVAEQWPGLESSEAPARQSRAVRGFRPPNNQGREMFQRDHRPGQGVAPGAGSTGRSMRLGDFSRAESCTSRNDCSILPNVRYRSAVVRLELPVECRPAIR